MRDNARVAVCHPEFLEDLQFWVENDRSVAKKVAGIDESGFARSIRWNW
jgi:toxin YoeB